MKQVFTLILSFFLFITSGFAQITLDSTHIGAIGSTYEVAHDTLPPMGVDQGEAGANQTWDLSNLTTHTVDSLKFVDPAATPYTADFPTANIAVQNTSIADGYAYFNLNSSTFTLLGAAGDPFELGATFSLPLDPTSDVIEFPFTYGNSFQDTIIADITVDATPFGIQFVDSGRFESITYRTIEADGFGTLILGQGTYNALRVKEVSEITETIWTLTFLGWSLFRGPETRIDSVFRWYDATRGYELASVNYTAGEKSEITYLDPNPVGIVDGPEKRKLIVFPNPSTGAFTAIADSPDLEVLEMIDLQGRIVAEIPFLNGRIEANLNYLPSGLFLYRGLNQDGNTVLTGKFLRN